MTLSVREAITTRRSIKNFNGELVEKEVLNQILQDASWAPNHGNREPWRVVIATDEKLPKVHELLRDLAIPSWNQLEEATLAAQMKKFTTAGAYAFVLVPEDMRQKERLEDYAAAASFLQNVQLLAWEQKIGSCWKTPGFLDHPKFREVLNARVDERVIAMVQFGHFDEVPNGKERKPLTGFVTEFGQ